MTSSQERAQQTSPPGPDARREEGETTESGDTAPGGAPPVQGPVGASWAGDRPVEPARRDAGVREDAPPEAAAVRRGERQARFLPPAAEGVDEA